MSVDITENKEFLDMKGGETRTYVVAEACEDLPETKIDELVKNYNPQFSSAPVTISHPDSKIKNPFAWGWVKNLVKKDKQMIAEMDLSEEMCELLDRGLLKTKSIAYRDLFDKEKFPKPYMVSIGFLGSELPRIKGMDNNAIAQSLAQLSDNAEEIKTIYFKETKKMDYTKEQVDQLVSDARLAARAEVEAEFKTQIKTFSEENKTFVEKIKNIETNYLKELAEKDKKINELILENDKTEIKMFVETAIKDGKIQPKDKEAKIARLLKVKSLDENLYKEFREEIEKSAKLIEFGANHEADGDENTKGLTKDDKDLGLDEKDVKEFREFDQVAYMRKLQQPANAGRRA